MLSQRYDSFWAGGFLYNRTARAVFLHKRDGNTPVNPHKWAFFGGQNEHGESYLQCFVREMGEEIGLKIRPEEPIHLREYMNELVQQYRVVFYVESSVSQDRLVLGEGAGFAWISLADVWKFDLADKTREDLQFFVERRL